jgi:NAD(P)-dependent dehydrogenase (short-subunit alcohol dehydrogenase family)
MPPGPRRITDRLPEGAFSSAGLIAAGPVEALDLDAMSEMISVNIDAAFRFAYAAVRHMKAVIVATACRRASRRCRPTLLPPRAASDLRSPQPRSGGPP